MLSDLLPSISELIGMIYNWATPIFNGFAPLVWYILGITLTFVFLSGLFNLIQNGLDDINDRKDAIRRLENSNKELNEYLHSKYSDIKND